MRQEDSEFSSKMNHIIGKLQHISWPFIDGDALDTSTDDGLDFESASQSALLVQAQALLAKNIFYQKIDLALKQLTCLQPAVYNNVPRTTTDAGVVSANHRDAVVSNLRLLNIFCNNSPVTFARAVGLLDRLLGQVKIHPNFLSFVATCCFFIAAKSQESNSPALDPEELLRLGRCSGTLADLLNTERLICETLQWNFQDASPLTFLQLFYEIFALHNLRDRHADSSPSLVAKLEVLMCQFEFTKFRADILALALLSYHLQECNVLSHPDHFYLVVELQYYCQMPESEFMHCRALVMEHLTLYQSRPTKLPHLQLSWTISRRTLHKMKPSTRVSQDLEPIMEDEDSGNGYDDDTGPFDSENDDGDIPNNRVLPTDGGLPTVGSCLDSYAFYSHQQDSCLPKAP
jgi:hypothetical protein